MSPETQGPAGPRKDSIFSGLTPPQGGAQPFGQPQPQPPKPAPDAEIVAALKRKVEEMEKKLAAQPEKEIGEQGKGLVSPAPIQANTLPPAQPARARQPDSEVFSRRMQELEAKLEELGRAASFSASQLRNIEESKISARREIEELLKAVREQQKYSELDRQMHDQLEKAWVRAEDLEKKLMAFYSSLMEQEARRREESAASSGRVADAVGALDARLARLEERLSVPSPVPGIDDLRRAAAELANRLVEESRRAYEALSARTAEEGRRAGAASEMALKEALSGINSWLASFKGAMGEQLGRELAEMRARISEETEAMKREASVLAQRTDSLLRDHAGSVEEKIAKFAELVQANRLRADGVEDALKVAAARQEQVLKELSERFFSESHRAGAELLAKLSEENRRANGELAARTEQESRAANEKLAERSAEEYRLAAEAGRSALKEVSDSMRESVSSLGRALEDHLGRELERMGAKMGQAAEALDSRLARALEALRGSVLEQTVALRSEAAASTEAAREQLRAQADLVEGKLAEFGHLMQANRLRAEGVEEALKASAACQTHALDELSKRLSEENRRFGEELSARLSEENRRASGELSARAAEDARRYSTAGEELLNGMLAAVRADMEAFRKGFDEYAGRELERLRAKVSGEAEALRNAAASGTEELRRETAALAEETRKLLRSAASAAEEKKTELEALLQANSLRAEGVEKALEAAAVRQAGAMEEFSARLGSELRAMNADFAAGLGKESGEKFEKFRARYADALRSATFAEELLAGVDAAIRRLKDYEIRLRRLLGAVSPERLERELGVSGVLARRHFEALDAAVDDVSEEQARLRELKLQLEERFKDVFREE